MLTKEQVIESIKNLPDKFSVDDLIDRIIILAKLDIGIEQSENNKITSDDELNKKLSKWFN